MMFNFLLLINYFIWNYYEYISLDVVLVFWFLLNTTTLSINTLKWQVNLNGDEKITWYLKKKSITAICLKILFKHVYEKLISIIIFCLSNTSLSFSETLNDHNKISSKNHLLFEIKFDSCINYVQEKKNSHI